MHCIVGESWFYGTPYLLIFVRFLSGCWWKNWSTILVWFSGQPFLSGKSRHPCIFLFMYRVYLRKLIKMQMLTLNARPRLTQLQHHSSGPRLAIVDLEKKGNIWCYGTWAIEIPESMHVLWPMCWHQLTECQLQGGVVLEMF